MNCDMESKDIKILVAHPGRQHSFRVATALKHNGLLFKYVTTVYNSKKSILMRLCKLVLTGDNYRRAERRKCPDVADEEVLQIEELEALILLLVQRLDKSRKVTNWLMHRVSLNFQKKLARYIIDNKVDAVISYDTNSSLLFDILKEQAPNVIKIIDNAHPCRNYLHEVYNEKLESSKEFVKTYGAEDFILDKSKALEYGLEAQKADLHIVASSFSKQACLFNNIREENIILAPYGVDKKEFKPLKKDFSNKLKVLFVGQVNQRKGILQILESAKNLNDYNIEFNIVGSGKEYCEYLYKPYEDYVNFMGRVPYETLKELYGTSHIFVFPSMGEGYGLVIPEALAAGLPVIASKNCFGPDIIKDGYNGFVIESGNTEELTDKILWFYNNMDKISEMEQNAINSVSELTWEKYEKILVEQLIEKIRNIKQGE